MTNDYPHIQFRRHWTVTPEISRQLGVCEGIIEALANMPILPDLHSRLLTISLIKGARATTAIEGNTLTDDEVRAVAEGKPLAPSKEYQEIEVRNILEAMNTLLDELADRQEISLITPDLILRFHQMIGKDLGEHFQAVPGRFAEGPRLVGPYRAPEHTDIEELVGKLCEWLREEFNFPSAGSFAQAAIQAIVTHVYIEWIHPFGDGNGRTGRLLEFYVLLRAGNPDFTSHILSNFYNETRAEYYRQLERAGRSADLTEFIRYAVQGLQDGLLATLRQIQKSQFAIAWQKLIYDRFVDRPYTKKSVFKRRRALMLAMPLEEPVSVVTAAVLTPELTRAYAALSDRTVIRDLQVLREMDLLVRVPGRSGMYAANADLLRRQMPRRLDHSALSGLER